MRLFKELEEVKEFLKTLVTALDRIDCLDYLILELEDRTKEEESSGVKEPSIAQPSNVSKKTLSATGGMYKSWGNSVIDSPSIIANGISACSG